MNVSIAPVELALVGTWMSLRGKWTTALGGDILEMLWEDLYGQRRKVPSRGEYVVVMPHPVVVPARGRTFWMGDRLIETRLTSIDGVVKKLASDNKGADFWLVGGRVYSTKDRQLTWEDVDALVNQAANRRRLALEKAHAIRAMTRELDSGSGRRPIPQQAKVAVWQRDGGRCVECGSNRDLEFDHVIPLAMGGSSTVRNLQLLCAVCNRTKGATLG